MPGLISKLVKGVGAGIGVASEAIEQHKERKKDKQADQSGESSREVTGSVPSEPAQEKHDDSGSDDDEHLTEKVWALDDASEQLDPPAYQEPAPPYQESDQPKDSVPGVDQSKGSLPGVDQVVESFLAQHDIPATFQYRPIPAPVVIPQRRPRDKTRGFVRAYAPVLGECSGIDQQLFLDFLQDFYKASLSSPVFTVINIAAGIVGLVPNPITMGVSIATQVVSRTGQEIQSRYRRNTFLDQMNEQLFQPRGLYALLMTFKTDSESPLLNIDTSTRSNAIYKSVSTPDSDLSKKLRNLRLSAGVSKGEIQLPQAAPLIFPVIDHAAAQAAASLDGHDPNKPLDVEHLSPDPSSKHRPSPVPMQSGSGTLSTTPTLQSTRSKSPKPLTTFGDGISDYLDRRAQAVYSSANPNSHLNVPSSGGNGAPKFASRFSDPNHPANSGSIIALLSGGRFDPAADSRVRRARRRAYRQGYELNETEEKQAMMNRRIQGRHWDGTPKRKTLIGKILQQDIMYLMICNMPSEAEMREYRQMIDNAKK